MGLDAVEVLRQQHEEPKWDPWLIRCLRVARGMTQAELGAALGFGYRPQERVCRIESYSTACSESRGQRIAAAMKCSRKALQSAAAEWKHNRAEFDAWDAAGRPDLRVWVSNRGN